MIKSSYLYNMNKFKEIVDLIDSLYPTSNYSEFVIECSPEIAKNLANDVLSNCCSGISEHSYIDTSGLLESGIDVMDIGLLTFKPILQEGYNITKIK